MPSGGVTLEEAPAWIDPSFLDLFGVWVAMLRGSVLEASFTFYAVMSKLRLSP